MSYPEDLELHLNDHMAFHTKSFWVDPSKAKEDNIKRNNSRGSTNSGPRTRSCYNCDDKRHFIIECPYENRELHNGRLIPKDKSKDSKGKYSKPLNKKFYNNKTKKGKRPSRVVLVTREEYSSDEVESSSGDEDEESSKEVAAIATTNIPLHLSLSPPMRILISRMHIASWQGPPWTHLLCYQLKKSIPPEMMMLMMKKMEPQMDWLPLPPSPLTLHQQVNLPMRSFMWRKKVAAWLNLLRYHFLTPLHLTFQMI